MRDGNDGGDRDQPPPEAAVISVVTLETKARADVAAVDVKVKVLEVEEVCRICHLSPDRTEGEGDGERGSVLIQIGCSCKNGLGSAHRDCAETWFQLKGNRCCEICGMNAKNVTGEEDGRFMVGWHDSRGTNNSGYGNSSERTTCCWRGQHFCSFLMACLVMAFILPWFLRVNMF